MDLQYPVGKFTWTRSGEGLLATEAERQEWLAEIEETPARLWAAVPGLTEAQLDTPYRPGGWTVRQVVHHLADSHAMAYTRCKQALTKDWPTEQPYDEAAWANLADSRLPIDVSLAMIEGLHGRWVALMESLTDDDFRKGYDHPERGRENLAMALAMYDWHSRHHVAHITSLRARQGW